MFSCILSGMPPPRRKFRAPPGEGGGNRLQPRAPPLRTPFRSLAVPAIDDIAVERRVEHALRYLEIALQASTQCTIRVALHRPCNGREQCPPVDDPHARTESREVDL